MFITLLDILLGLDTDFFFIVILFGVLYKKLRYNQAVNFTVFKLEC